jgi:hypothetical protein
VDGWVQRFHRGAFELAVQLKQDILPIVLCDTNTAMPRDSYWFEPYHVTVRALPRITPQNFDYSLGVLALMRHCETIVREGLQRQLDEVNTPRVVRRKVERLYRYQGKFVEQFVLWKMKMDPMFPALDALVPRHGFILDLGCGYGVVTHWLAAYTDTRTFLGIDYDEDKIRVAQRSAHEHRRMRFEVGRHSEPRAAGVRRCAVARRVALLAAGEAAADLESRPAGAASGRTLDPARCRARGERRSSTD